MLGPALGAVALLDIRRRGRTGRSMAVAGIATGLVALLAWGAVARWWHVHARMPLLYGPVEALSAGLAGDAAAFEAAFEGGHAAGEAPRFLAEVAARHGRLIGSSQRVVPGRAPAAGQRRIRVPYSLEFESGPVDAEAEFVTWSDESRGLVLKFAWLAIYDEELGDLIFPASAAGSVKSGAEAPQEPTGGD